MTVYYSRQFVKQYKKLSAKVQEQFRERLQLWLEDPDHPQLRNHPLSGIYQGYWSFNVTGDIRVIYTYIENSDAVELSLIGTHSQLYG